MNYEEKQYLMDMAELEDVTIDDFKKALVQLRTGPGINEDVSEEYNDAADLAILLIEQEMRKRIILQCEDYETCTRKKCYDCDREKCVKRRVI